MSKIDDLIREALEGEDRMIMEETRELGFFALGLKQFTGTYGWVTWVLMIAQTAWFIVGVWCAFNFFGASDVLAALKWGISGAVAFIVSLQLKLSLSPQMQADRVIRELKRIQLMIANRES